MSAPDWFDFKAPDYPRVYQMRATRLRWLRAHDEPFANREKVAASRLAHIMAHYRDAPWDLINDWGETFDPRNADIGLPSYVPFLLMPRQKEFLEEVYAQWKAREHMLAEKARDAGLSWLAVSFGCALCLTHRGVNIGYGSRKEEYVDKIDGPKSLFFKARKFLERLPPEIRGNWNPAKDAPHMRIIFRDTESNMTGEAGDNIGRGDRATIYFTDEEAFLEHPELVERSLSQTTRCRISISTPNGSANPFAQKRFSGRVKVFTYHWFDDLRKDQAWFEKQERELDPVTLAQEVLIDYNASVEGVLIPSNWVQAAVGAAEKLGLVPSGIRMAALDVADEGVDFNAFAGGTGFSLDTLEEWSGKGGDIFQTTERAFLHCDEHEFTAFLYDADGLGAGVRGDANVINARRPSGRKISVEPYRGSGKVLRPEKKEYYGRANEDFFANLKAQAGWALRERFRATYRWVKEGQECDPDTIISIDPKLKLLPRLLMELSQPTYSINTAGKIMIDKKPDGAKSPNLYDAVAIRFSGVQAARLVIPRDVVEAARRRR